MKRGRPIGSKYKNPQIRKGAKMKNNPNEDVETLKELSNIIDFKVPEELIRYLKFMKIKRSR